jgi:hypothetical protein
MKILDEAVTRLLVIPAKAGIQAFLNIWIPACAGFRQLGRNDGREKSQNPQHMSTA